MTKITNYRYILRKVVEFENRSGMNVPLHFIDLEKVKENYTVIRDTFFSYYPKVEIYYAIMANNEKEVLELLLYEGSGVQVQSIREYLKAKEIGYSPENIVFTSKLESRETLEYLIREGVQINISCLEALEDAGKIVKKYREKNIKVKNKFGIRVRLSDDLIKKINKNKNATNKPGSALVGIPKEKIYKVKEIADRYRIIINGVHGYGASNTKDPELLKEIGEYIADVGVRFNTLEYINFGGGLGVPSKRDEKGIDIREVAEYYDAIVREVSREIGREIVLQLEPGRPIVANAGMIVVKVSRVVTYDDKKVIGVNASLADLGRIYIYHTSNNFSPAGYHEIINLSRMRGREIIADISTTDTMQETRIGVSRKIIEPKEGDYLAIMNTGAYAIKLKDWLSAGEPSIRNIFIK